MRSGPAVLALLAAVSQLAGQTAWPSFANGPQHNARAPVASQPLVGIRWQTPVDLQPQYSGSDLLIHYGSPLITAGNTVLVPVKTGADGGFRLEAHAAAGGQPVWSADSDYVLPPHNWTPVFGPALAGSRVYFPGAGGTVYFRDTPDSGTGASGQIVFYGAASYNADRATYNSNLFINTPLMPDAAGNLYFGFLTLGDTPLHLTSGIARISASGAAVWTSVTAASGDPAIIHVDYNCAPALSLDGRTLYVAVSDGSAGYLLALDSATLATLGKVRLRDPATGADAYLSDDASSSPTVGPDGDVYYGVLENDLGTNHERGWLLHFNAALTQSKTPGAFGWDDTASVVPATMVPSYSGTSSYLLMTKYNDYLEAGGNGFNRLAVLDPKAAQTDPVTGALVMKEVLTVAGRTPVDPPPAVKEWCINSAVVDPATHSILAGSEDGKLYRWDLTTNSLSETVVLTPGIGEAYTPTLVGPDGTVYAINNATLFAVGSSVAPAITVSPGALNFAYTIGGPAPPQQTLTIASNPPGLAVTVTATCPLLTVSPATGVTPLQATVTFQTAGLTPGTYACAIQINGPGGSSAMVVAR